MPAKNMLCQKRTSSLSPVDEKPAPGSDVSALHPRGRLSKLLQSDSSSSSETVFPSMVDFTFGRLEELSVFLIVFHKNGDLIMVLCKVFYAGRNLLKANSL